jgi:hypothetical protein
MKGDNYIFNRKLNFRGAIILLFLAGIGYICIQWKLTGKIVDWIFAIMLTSASIFLLFRLRKMFLRLVHSGLPFYHSLYQNSNISGSIEDSILEEFQNDIGRIFDNKNTILSGLAFDSIFIAGIMYMGIWSGNFFIRIGFLAFLCIANFITGCGIYSLFRLLFIMKRWIRQMHIDVWRMQSEAMRYIRRLRNEIVNIISVYISVCLSSVIFSVIDTTRLFIGYVAFAVLLLAVTFFFPEIAFSKKITEEENVVIEYFNDNLKIEYARISKNRTENNQQGTDLACMLEILETREKIHAIFKEQSPYSTVFPFLSAVFITALPIILQLLLDYI